MVRRSSTLNFERIAHIQDRLDLVPADVLDEVSMIEVLREHRPSEVYNLAAQSFVQTSWSQPVLTGEVTALGVTRVLDAIRLTDPEIRFYQASSSEMFGKVREVPQTEHDAVLPAQPLRGGEGLRALDHRQLPRELRAASPPRGSCSTTRARAAASSSSPRKVTHGVARIKLGLDRSSRLGNLDAKRDWGFAGDYVQAMWLMLQQDEPDDYVVATGETHSVRELCEVAFASGGSTTRTTSRSTSASCGRPRLTSSLATQPRHTRSSVGRPTVDFAGLVEMMVDADLELLAPPGFLTGGAALRPGARGNGTAVVSEGAPAG